MGPRLLKLLGWLAEHGAKIGVNPLFGEEAEVTKAWVMEGFCRASLSVALPALAADGGVLGAGAAV
jgi:hypothetical protein